MVHTIPLFSSPFLVRTLLQPHSYPSPSQLSPFHSEQLLHATQQQHLPLVAHVLWVVHPGTRLPTGIQNSYREVIGK